MKDNTFLSTVKISESYMRRARQIAEAEICKRSLVRIPMYFFLFLTTLYVTPFGKRFPEESAGLGAMILLLSLFRIYVAYRLPKNPDSKLKKLMALSIYMMGMLWGLMSSVTIQFFELGWVSFFVLLSTSGIAAAEMSALAPSFITLSSFMVLILGPTVFSGLILVKGLSGSAIGFFFLIYLLFLIFQGREEFNDYWDRLRENSQLLAMMDSVPGTLSWVTSDLKYKGVNRRMAQLWNGEPASFIGKSIGFLDPSSRTVEFTRSIFQSDTDALSVETQLTIQGKLRTYFLFGQKYNLGTEAIILGLDVTEMRESEKTVLIERAQRFYSARLANVGQVTNILYTGIKNHTSQILSEVEKDASLGQAKNLIASLRRLNDLLETVREISDSETLGEKGNSDVTALLSKVLQIFDAFASFHGIRLDSEIQEGCKGVSVPMPAGQLGTAVISLLSNAFDAVSEGGVKDKRVALKCEMSSVSGGSAGAGKMISISIVDSGKGIPESVRGRLFEPLFSTKSPEHSTGTGLSISKEMIESYGGRIEFDAASAQTRFVIHLPTAK